MNDVFNQSALYFLYGCAFNGFKERTSFEIHQQFPNQNFQWQSRFYDIIIKNPESHNKIQWYILNNVLNWEDKNNPRFFEEVK